MLEAKCQKCGTRYYGWALKYPQNLTCSECGGSLDVYEQGKLVSKGYPPAAYEKYFINLN